ncbi:hypothetical protein GCM10023235_11220 [Kitasatospora terrestris]|uniref:Uncharacterized protein n=1 Tax=Kitasatospora terrestris TaxID=258051 RepID=A0ABP9DI09_9ACTN
MTRQAGCRLSTESSYRLDIAEVFEALIQRIAREPVNHYGAARASPSGTFGTPTGTPGLRILHHIHHTTDHTLRTVLNDRVRALIDVADRQSID